MEELPDTWRREGEEEGGRGGGGRGGGGRGGGGRGGGGRGGGGRGGGGRGGGGRGGGGRGGGGRGEEGTQYDLLSRPTLHTIHRMCAHIDNLFLLTLRGILSSKSHM